MFDVNVQQTVRTYCFTLYLVCKSCVLSVQEEARKYFYLETTSVHLDLKQLEFYAFCENFKGLK